MSFSKWAAQVNKGCEFTWCPNQPATGNGTCESCLDRVRDEDSVAYYTDYADYMTEKTT